MGQSTEELTARIEDTRERMASDVDALQEKVSPSAIMQRRKDAARHRFSSLRDKVMGAAQGAGSTIGDKTPSSGDLQAGARSAVGSAQGRVQGSPIAAGVVAFGAGMVISALLPASRAEAEAAHRVVETAKDKGQPLADDLKSAGQQLGQDVKEQATQAARDVKDSATESARQVRDEAQSSAGTVRSEAGS